MTEMAQTTATDGAGDAASPHSELKQAQIIGVIGEGPLSLSYSLPAALLTQDFQADQALAKAHSAQNSPKTSALRICPSAIFSEPRRKGC